MIREMRQAFNAQWTEARHRALVARLTARVGVPIEFPLSETPCFFPQSLIRDLAEAGEELIRQSMAGEAAVAAAAVVPARFRGPGAGERPAFLQVDFGLVREDDGRIAPRLVELQAFPSLYGFQTALADAYRETYAIPPEWSAYLGDLTAESYRDLVREVIVGPHDPTEAILMEIDPDRQKTRPDFAVTESLWGVRAVDTADVVKDGRRLFARRDGRLTRIRRIYNRVIPDELESRQVVLPFDYRDELDVEWVGHPEWYFRISKFSIPWLRHASVPRTWFLHEVDALPAPRERLLLKPLFSFAGGGIIFAPSDDELAAVPRERRDQFILQEKIDFTPVIETPHGPTQVEVRMMFVWTDRLRAVLPLLRMGRGKMMGVDHNKGLRWVGASAGLVAAGR
jgi:hypothetical protein